MLGETPCEEDTVLLAKEGDTREVLVGRAVNLDETDAVTDLSAEMETVVVLEELLVAHALDVREGALLEDGDPVIERERAAVALELEQGDSLVDRKLERERVPVVDSVTDTREEPEIEPERAGDNDADADCEVYGDELGLRDVVGDTDREVDCVGDNVSVEFEV